MFLLNKIHFLIPAGIVFIGISATAKPICVPRQFMMALTNGTDHTSVTGAVFSRDFSNPSLGEAYRDPSGLIWGEFLGKNLTHENAILYCSSIGARLPTLDETHQLAQEFGAGELSGDPKDPCVWNNYSPYEVDGRTAVLPLRNAPGGQDFWTSEYSTPGYYYVFDLMSGVAFPASSSLTRCVSF